VNKAVGFFLFTLLMAKSNLLAIVCNPSGSGDDTNTLRGCIANAVQSDNVIEIKGVFTISDQIVVLPKVALKGVGTYGGSQINIVFGKGYSYNDKSKAAFILKEGAVIDGLTFFYPDQEKGKKLEEFPPTISVQGSFCRVVNSFFPNSYVGIEASVPHGKLNMQNLEFGVFYRAIRDDQCYDIDKFNVIHANPAMWRTWQDDSDVFNWMFENSALIEVARIDWLWINTVFSFGTKYGILINSSEYGTVGEAQIIQAGCDACQYGIYVDPQSKHFPWLLTISNWSGTAFNSVNGKGSGVSIYICNTKGVTISDSNFWGIRDDGVYLENCENISLSNLNFLDNGWNIANNGSAAIHLSNCKLASIFGGGGSNSHKSSVGIIVEDSSNVTIVGTKFIVPASSIVIRNSSGVVNFGNSGNVCRVEK